MNFRFRFASCFASATAVCLLLMISGQVCANGDIYVSYGADGTPRFATQPYDSSYVLYLREPSILVGETARIKSRSAPSSAQSAQSRLAERRAQLASLIEQTAREHDISPALLSAVTEVESGFDPQAVSPKGAVGAMQLIPKTAAEYGVTNPRDAQQNLNGGTRYLKDLLRAHQGNLALALAAYNAGPGKVLRYERRIPPFNETMLYVPRVLAKMAEYQRQYEAQP